MSKRTEAGRALRIALMASTGVVAVAATGVGAVSTLHVPRVKPMVHMMGTSLGGLNKAEAERRVQAWFSEVQKRPLMLVSDSLEQNPNMTPESLGVTLDLAATMRSIPVDTFWDEALRNMGQSKPTRVDVVPVLKVDTKKAQVLADWVNDFEKPSKKARARWVDGKIVRSQEQGGVELDVQKHSDAVIRATLDEAKVEIPLREAAKRVSDEDLEKITEVVAAYSTRFNSGQVARSSNIRTAASIIDGMILLPGEKFSFNDTVGRRSVAGGFRIAGVLVNGRKDYDVGGGICQVSTTLYNAALLADLKIVNRSPHSAPVPYVPLGRDAAVSYPNPDLEFQNTSDTPVAIAALYQPGKLEVKVLGQAHGKEVSIVTGGASSWGNGVKVVQDDTLGYGVEKVMERGSSGRRITAWRVVKQDGVEVRRDSLGTSIYRGSPRIIARNAKAKAPVAPAPAEPTGEAIEARPKPVPRSQPVRTERAAAKPSATTRKPATASRRTAASPRQEAAPTRRAAESARSEAAPTKRAAAPARRTSSTSSAPASTQARRTSTSPRGATTPTRKTSNATRREPAASVRKTSASPRQEAAPARRISSSQREASKPTQKTSTTVRTTAPSQRQKPSSAPKAAQRTTESQAPVRRPSRPATKEQAKPKAAPVSQTRRRAETRSPQGRSSQPEEAGRRQPGRARAGE